MADDVQVFDAAFRRQIDDVAEACVGCGACYDVCPITKPAGLDGLDGEAVTQDIRRILKGSETEDADAAAWATACVLSGDCIDACEHGVNPRLMLTLARMVGAENRVSASARKDNAIDAFRNLGDGVKTLSRIQLSKADLARLGQGPGSSGSASPDVVFYTGCNVLKTPHIALLCLDILDVIGIDYTVMGGPSHCCGILQYRAGDMDTSSKISANSINKFRATGATEVLSWCPTCQVQFDEIGLPVYRDATGEDPFAMTPFVLFLADHLEDLKPHLVRDVDMRVALHLHPGIRGLPEAAKAILGIVPGVSVVDLALPEIGLMSNALATIPDYKKQLQRNELEAAAAAGVDALAAVYHADHRELCAHEKERPFQVINFLELVAASMGIVRTDAFKALKMKQDTDAILQDCVHLMQENGIDPAKARPVIEKALLGEQPLPLRGP